ncbi:MAG TPA: RDD family protein [Ktedonosporobacter sp.]|nr:RDD family protein [Ktedonosporobacter sp.]
MQEPPNRRRDQDQQKNAYDRLSSAHEQDQYDQSQQEQSEYDQSQYGQPQTARQGSSDPVRSDGMDYGQPQTARQGSSDPTPYQDPDYGRGATLDPPATTPDYQSVRYDAPTPASSDTLSHNSAQALGYEPLQHDTSQATTYQPISSNSAFFNKTQQNEQQASTEHMDYGQGEHVGYEQPQGEQMSYGVPQSRSPYGAQEAPRGSADTLYGTPDSSYGSTDASGGQESPYGAQRSPFGATRSAFGAQRSQSGAQYAEVWQRAIALAIDSILVGIVASLIAGIFGIGRPNPYTGEVTGGLSFLTFILYMGYFIYMEGTRGATFGKRLMGLRVVRADGQPLGMTETVIRNLLRVVDQFLFGLVGFFSIMATPRRQRLGDMAAKTIVVKSGRGIL